MSSCFSPPIRLLIAMPAVYPAALWITPSFTSHVPRLPPRAVRHKSLHSSLHVRYGSHGAEIVVDKFVVDPRYYYVVQPIRQREIVGWGVAPDFDSAIEEAEQLVIREDGEAGNSKSATPLS